MARRKTSPPNPRPLGADERERLGRQMHQIWAAVRRRQIAMGRPVSEDDLLPWDELSDPAKAVFCNSGEDVAVVNAATAEFETALFDRIAEVRQEIGEKAFRLKLFTICVEEAVERITDRPLSACEKKRAAETIVKMAGMLDVPPSNPVPPPNA